MSDDREQYLQIADDLLAEAIEAPEDVRRSLHNAAMRIIGAGDGRCGVRECCPPVDVDDPQARLSEMQAQLERLVRYIEANPVEGDNDTADRIREIARG